MIELSRPSKIHKMKTRAVAKKTINLVVDATGDVYLAPGKTSGDPVQILVSSDFMSRGSPIFKRMLTGDFSESSQVSKKNPGLISLPEDSPEAVILLAKVLHQAFDIPEMVDLQEFEDFAFLCHKYDCVNKVRAWAHMWAGRLLYLAEKSGSRGISQYFSLVHSTFALDLWEDFNTATVRLIRDFSVKRVADHSSRWNPNLKGRDQDYGSDKESEDLDNDGDSHDGTEDSDSTEDSDEEPEDAEEEGNKLRFEFEILPEDVFTAIEGEQSSRLRRFEKAIQTTLAKMSNNTNHPSDPACLGQEQNIPFLTVFLTNEKIWNPRSKSLSYYFENVSHLDSLDWTGPDVGNKDSFKVHSCERCSGHLDIIEDFVAKTRKHCQKVPGVCLDCIRDEKTHTGKGTCRLALREKEIEERAPKRRRTEMSTGAARMVAPPSREARMVAPPSREARMVAPPSRAARMVAPPPRAARMTAPSGRR